MDTVLESRKLSIERRNEIAVRALVYMKIRNGCSIDFFNYERTSEKRNSELAKNIKCSNDEIKKFIKEDMFIIFQQYCKVMGIKEPNFNYQQDKDQTWVKRRNEIGFAIFIHESTKGRVNLHFRPDSGEKKTQLCGAYQCNDEELKLFGEEITHIILTKALAMYK